MNTTIYYHGSDSKNPSFSFDTQPIFFSTNKEYAKDYGKYVSKYHIDIKKPFDTKDEEARKIYNDYFIPFALEYTDGEKRYIPLKHGESITFITADLVYLFLRKSKREGIDYGYDSVIVDEKIGAYNPKTKNRNFNEENYSIYPLSYKQINKILEEGGLIEGLESNHKLEPTQEDKESTIKALEGTNLRDIYIGAVLEKNNEPLIKAIGTLFKPNKSASAIAENLRDVYMLIVDYDGNRSFPDYACINLGSCMYFAQDLSTFFTRNGIKNEIQDPYNIWHVWVYSEGKYYDAEATEGVDNVKDLPLFGNESGYKEGGLITPSIKKSNLTKEQQELVRTPAFKEWFGDWENDPQNASKVVDENGEPLVVYHGTKKQFYLFEKQNYKQNPYLLGNDNNIGFFFTKSKDKAFEYGGGRIKEGEKIYPKDLNVLELFLNIRSPYSFTFAKYADFTKRVNDGELMKEQLKALGYDGFQIEKFYTIGAFEPSQIKLADGTNTTFGNKINDIRFKDGGSVVGFKSNLTKEQQELVRTPTFKKWFGDWENSPETASKMLDENGEPMVFYRGNLVNQEELGYTFNLGNNFLKKNTANNFGFFFTNKIDIAKKYMAVDLWDEIKGGSITCVFIKSNKTLDLTDFGLKISQDSFVEGLIVKGISFDNQYKYLLNQILNFDSETYKYWGANIFDYFDAFPKLRNLFMENGFTSVIFYEMSRVYSKYKVFVAFEPSQIKLADGTNTTFDNTLDIRYKDGGSLNSNGNFKTLGTAKELGIIPKIEGDDKIALCECGNMFSYVSFKEDAVWQCPKCEKKGKVKGVFGGGFTNRKYSV